MAGALALLREVLQAMRQTVGSQHHMTLGVMQNLVMLLYQAGREDEARGLCREAVTTARQVVGAHHPVYQAMLGNPWGLH